MKLSARLVVSSATVGLEILTVVLLCTVGGHLCTSHQQQNNHEDELLGELDLLLPKSGDNIQVRNVYGEIKKKSINTPVRRRLRVKYNYFELILKLFRCFISHVTASETETKLFLPPKEFWYYFKNISATFEHVEKYSFELKFIFWNNYETL